MSKNIKITLSQHRAITQALPAIIALLNVQGVPCKYHAAGLSEVYVKMAKQAVEVKDRYSLNLSETQKLALVLAVQFGLFNTDEYTSITARSIMMELHPKLL